MSYEAFEMTGVRMAAEAAITILKQGNFGINRRAAVEFFKGAKYASLHYDRAARRIGIRPEEKKAPHAYEIRGQDGKGAMQISGSAFLRYFGIEHKTTKSYPCRWNEKEKVVEIELGK